MKNKTVNVRARFSFSHIKIRKISEYKNFVR